MHHKNSIISIFLMGGFLALSLAGCESPRPPYPDNAQPTPADAADAADATATAAAADATAVRYPFGDFE